MRQAPVIRCDDLITEKQQSVVEIILAVQIILNANILTTQTREKNVLKRYSAQLNPILFLIPNQILAITTIKHSQTVRSADVRGQNNNLIYNLRYNWLDLVLKVLKNNNNNTDDPKQTDKKAKIICLFLMTMKTLTLQ